MRAIQRAHAALDTSRGIPDRDVDGDVSLLVLRRGGREGAVHRHGGDRQIVAVAGDHDARHFLDEFRSVGRDGGLHRFFGVDDHLVLRHFGNGLETGVDGLVVHGHDGFALLAIGLDDVFPDLGDRGLGIHDLTDHEEGGLKDGVGPAAKADLLSFFDGVDREEAGLLGDQLFLDLLRQMLPSLLCGVIEGGDEEGAAFFEVGEHVVLFKEGVLVAGDEVSLRDQVSARDGVLAETEVRSGQAAGLLGVVDEVALGVVVGVVADDLNGVLVGADRAVGTEAVEHGAIGVGVFLSLPGRIVRKGGAHDVVVDADREVILRFFGFQVVKDAFAHGVGEFLAAQAVAAADDHRHSKFGFAGLDGFGDGGANIFVERFALGAGLFGPVEDSHALDGGGESGREQFAGEGTEEADFHKTDLFALLGESGHDFFHGAGAGTHGDDHVLGFGVSDVLVDFVLASDDLGEFIHGVLHEFGAGLVIFVDGLAALEVNVRVLGGAAHRGPIRAEAALAVF